MKLAEILYDSEYTSENRAEDIEITGICADTDHEIAGSVFVCIKGSKFDTHCLLGYIKDKGAAAVLVQEGENYSLPPKLPCFVVKNTRIMLARLWSRYSKSPQTKLKIIGITGTNGKTSTAFMLHAALVAGGIKTGLIGTVGCFVNETPLDFPLDAQDAMRLETMTTPDPDLLYPILEKMVDLGVSHVVLEVSSHALHFDKCEPIAFEIGIFTNLASDHLDLHQTKEEYRKAKEKLFRQCKIGIWNADDPAAEEMISNATSHNIRCSLYQQLDYYIRNRQLQGVRGVSFMLCGRFGRLTVPMQIPGQFTLYNALLACAAALTLQVSPGKVREGLRALTGVKGRIERLDTQGMDFSVFIDYAHTEEALRNLLKTVRGFCNRNERIVAVFGCGGDRDQTKRSLMGKCAEELADFSIITSDNNRSEAPRKIILDILKGYTKKENRKVILDRQKAVEYAILQAQPRDVILLIGKGHEAYQISGKEKHPFDERKIVADAIKKRKNIHTNEDSNEG